jgi:anti-sigma factor ChrR (cupin superfamily)
MLNADFSQRCVIDSSTLPWEPYLSPSSHRRLLESDGIGNSRVTSIVRFDAGAKFDLQMHDIGSEFLVLEGKFSDAFGTYGPGTYLKNPPSSRSAPFSEEGCTLLVKLGHLTSEDNDRVIIGTRESPWYPGMVDGLTVLPLSEFGTTHTAMVRWALGTHFNPHRHYGGEEIFVIDGVFSDEHGTYPKGSWIRSPHLSQHKPFSKEGCVILVKTGHLPV